MTTLYQFCVSTVSFGESNPAKIIPVRPSDLPPLPRLVHDRSILRARSFSSGFVAMFWLWWPILRTLCLFLLLSLPGTWYFWPSPPPLREVALQRLDTDPLPSDFTYCVRGTRSICDNLVEATVESRDDCERLMAYLDSMKDAVRIIPHKLRTILIGPQPEPMVLHDINTFIQAFQDDLTGAIRAAKGILKIYSNRGLSTSKKNQLQNIIKAFEIYREQELLDAISEVLAETQTMQALQLQRGRPLRPLSKLQDWTAYWVLRMYKEDVCRRTAAAE